MPVIIPDATAVSNAGYGQGTGPIFLNNLRCTGTETNILSCPGGAVTSTCTHRDDAGVNCITDRK